MKVTKENYQTASLLRVAKSNITHMKNLDTYALSELKLIYSILHSQVLNKPDLMDSDLMQDLQTFLQSGASKDGVDVSDHGAWDIWLSQ